MYERVFCKRKTLAEWAEENPSINPFSECQNIGQLGGADYIFDEFLYRYSDRYIFKESSFVSTIERVFKFNAQKYARLLSSLNATYDVFSNYKVEKSGSEVTSFDVDNAKTGSETEKPNLSQIETRNLADVTTETPLLKETRTETPRVTDVTTETPLLTETKTETPRVTSTTTETPTIKDKTTETPDITTTTTETPDNTVTTTRTPNLETSQTETPRVVTQTQVQPLGYAESEITSSTTYDDYQNFKPVNKSEMSHTPNQGYETTIVTPTSGTNQTDTSQTGTETTVSHTLGESTTEVAQSGSNTSVHEYLSGNVTTVVSKDGLDTTLIEKTGTNTLETSHTGENTIVTDKTGSNSINVNKTGTDTITKSGTDTKEYDVTESKDGTEELEYINRVDRGYMYRPPQDAIEDEIKLARFNLVDIILKDVEQKVLISIYPG